MCVTYKYQNKLNEQKVLFWNVYRVSKSVNMWFYTVFIKVFAHYVHLLRRGECTTGSVRAGLVCNDSSPRSLWEWLVVVELWGTWRHAEQPPTDGPPHDTHTSDALNPITTATWHNRDKQRTTTENKTKQKKKRQPPCHKTRHSVNQ